MVNGAEEMGVRGSICESVFIVAAGAPGGVRLPWAKAVESSELKIANSASSRVGVVVFMIRFRLCWSSEWHRRQFVVIRGRLKQCTVFNLFARDGFDLEAQPLRGGGWLAFEFQNRQQRKELFGFQQFTPLILNHARSKPMPLVLQIWLKRR